ncbi:MAG: hypothetical protein HZA90_07040 [Verrucomicrobia bacterium]|nr:hypothetical protein [Verrucomicrobiota bacterium]
MVLRLGAIAALAGVLAAIAFQRRATGRLNEENQVLREQEQEAERLAQENEQLPQLRTNTANLEALRVEGREVEKLRAEVWRLRPQLKDRDQLLAENQRLAALPKAPGGAVSRLAEMPGYVAAASFSDAGFATPEDALQTFFHAMQRGDWERIFESLTAESLGELQESLSEKAEEARVKEGEQMLATFRVKGYRLASKEVQSEDRVVLILQTSADGEPHRMTLRRVGTDWKLKL